MKANEKLRLLDAITRHDIVNQLVVLTGYLEMTRGLIDEEKPNFTNEIDELDYIHEILIFKYAQLEIKLNTLINAYKKLMKKHQVQLKLRQNL